MTAEPTSVDERTGDRPARAPAARELRRGDSSEGFTVWFTGLSGAGKSSIASAAAQAVGALGLPVEVLDAEELRKSLCADLGFSREDRDTNVRRIGLVARLLTRHGVAVFAAAISPYRAVRDELRQEIGSFVEVYVRASLDELIRRDPKGLYRRALAGELSQFTGISDRYEEPLAPELVIDTERETIDQGVSRLIDRLRELGYLPNPRPA